MVTMSDDYGDVDRGYDNSHKAFLQAFLARSVMTLDEAKPILAKILSAHDDRETLPDDITATDIQSYIATVNAAISPLDYEIRHTHRQTASPTTNHPTSTQQPSPRTLIYALVNTVSDLSTQLATTHSPDDIAFVKRVLDDMFEKNNTPKRETMAVKGIDALRNRRPPNAPETQAQTPRRSEGGEGAMTQMANGGSGGTALTVDRAEKVLQGLVEEGWFEKSRAGFLSLSPRALMELRGWLYDTYNEAVEGEEEGERWVRIKDCEGCKDIVTIGQRCANPDCLVRFHNFCAQGFFRNGAAKNCPRCQTEWTGQDFVGQEAAKGMAAQRRQRGQRVGRGQASAEAVESETE
ncbi:hypothetical protein P152DRAFT_430699 [Eremomyces bilateralis CBS 781.70]|uniref:Non-structural maintenance of chromosomes element 1 homolog n=1 Tax=Eremomyces bilateralis CBS 781.70 TaxID=1392243 RepID=A0A6G1GA20_9PEZI|nr:uncharacterized protein P152DRAFT_430699 [Eremomyces bilateralis CBS 781.70]KAF1814760.1 hypothetical protein P152DRAFT_430699 [Eremomyces bilateralis CBS 781.70]